MIQLFAPGLVELQPGLGISSDQPGHAGPTGAAGMPGENGQAVDGQCQFAVYTAGKNMARNHASRYV